MNNLHISANFKLSNSSRLRKQTKSIATHQPSQRVYVAGIFEEGFPSDEVWIAGEDEGSPIKIEIKRFQFRIKLSKSLLINIIRRFEFYIKIFWYYRDKKIGMINVHMVDLLPFGVLLKFLYGAKLVYDAEELETETRLFLEFKTNFRKNALKFIEKWCIKKADQVIVVSESIADWYMKAYNIERPLVLLNSPRLVDVSKKNHFRKKFNIPDEAKIVIYQGFLTKARGIHLLLDTFKQRDDMKVVLVLMGYGDLEEQVKQSASHNKNIFFHPAVSPNVLLEYTASADIGITCIENSCLSHNYCMPNKLFEYAMAGLPVIVSDVEEMKRFVLDNQMGLVFEERTAQSLNDAINKLLNMDFLILQANARRAARSSSWDIQERKMLDTYVQLGYFPKKKLILESEG